MKPKLAATAQKPKMTESTTLLEQAEGGVVAEVAAARHLREDANAAAAVLKQADGRLVVEAAAARHSSEVANTAAAEMEQAAATRNNLGEDANITAAKNLGEEMQTQQQQKKKQR